jgi:hypothetical protein
MPITTIAYHGGAGLEEVKVLGQPISNSKIAGTRTAQGGKKIRCICEKRVASFNKTQ